MTIKNILIHKLSVFFYLLDKNTFINLPEKFFIKCMYNTSMKKKIDLNKPKTFNEKLQWLKLYNRNDVYTTMVDKFEVKKYVASKIGEEYIVPTLGVYDRFNDIDFEKLPERFVMKCTHDSDSTIVVEDKNNINFKEIKDRLNKHLKHNYYYDGREWPYKNVKPRIIIEKNLIEKNNKSIRDYKFFCFDGEPKIMYISDDSHTDNQTIAFFDMNFNKLDIKRSDYKNYKTIPSRPKNFEKMKKFATILSKNIPHIRVDFYEINGHLYFGELTFTTGGGLIPFEDEKWDRIMGDWIKLPIDK